MTFCGIFDGHGLWGHHVAKRVRKLIPSFLLCHWQETLALASLSQDFGVMELDRNFCRFEMWRQSYLKTFAAIDEELEQHAGVDSFSSGTTALTMIRQVRNWHLSLIKHCVIVRNSYIDPSRKQAASIRLTTLIFIRGNSSS